MAEASASEETQITFSIKSSSDAKYNLTLPATTTVADLKTKLSGSEYADIPTDRIRLIYSGRVLKDPDTLASVKIKDGHTIHLVKGAASNARQNPANQGGASTTPSGTNPPAAAQVPTNIAAGTGNNPLAGLTGARFAGLHGLPGADTFGPDGGMGGGPDPDSLLRMMENPMFLSQMNEAMNNPAVIQMMQDSPMLRNNPVARQMLENPEFRRMLMNPETIRAQLQMQRSFNQGGGGFPAPGVTNTTPQDQQNNGSETGTGTPGSGGNAQPPNPFAALGGPSAGGNPFAMFGNQNAGGTGGANPFAALFGGGNNPFGANPAGSPPPAGSTNEAGQAGQPGQTGQPPQPGQNPFDMLQQLAQLQQMLGGGNNGGGAGQDPFAQMANMFGGMPQQNQPPDNRPPEEIYADQLRQLNEIGFHDFERNVQALRRSGGNVQGAINLLLGE